MTHVFDRAPGGLQPAPDDARVLAASHRVIVHAISFETVHDKESLMLAFLRGLALPPSFGRNWDALYDVLTDPEQRPARSALLLSGYAHFQRQHPHLGASLERVLLEAQAESARQGQGLWLLVEENGKSAGPG